MMSTTRHPQLDADLIVGDMKARIAELEAALTEMTRFRLSTSEKVALARKTLERKNGTD
jgi:hypothetical protein